MFRQTALTQLTPCSKAMDRYCSLGNEMWSPPTPCSQDQTRWLPLLPMRTGSKNQKPDLTCSPGPQELRENIFAIGGNVKGCSDGKTDQTLYRVCMYLCMYVGVCLMIMTSFQQQAMCLLQPKTILLFQRREICKSKVRE